MLVNVEDIGLVKFVINNRIKRISIKVKPFQPIIMNVPLGTDEDIILQTLLDNKKWIEKAKAKIKQKENKITVFDDNTNIETSFFTLSVKKHNKSNVSYTNINDKLTIYYPANKSIKTPIAQDGIRKIFEELLRYYAKQYLPKRVMLLAKKWGFRYNKVSVRKAKTRWGSCSTNGNISLNIHLIRLPKILIDYVILHELCHTIEHNHSEKFWVLMDRVTDNKSKMYREQMKEYSTEIY